MSKVGLLGDVMLGRGVGAELDPDAPGAVWSAELRELCADCDVVLANLECCISRRGEPTGRIRGKPFFFRSPPEGVGALEAAGVGAVGLANNHALDYEVPALEDTLAHLERAGIATTGAGADAVSARRGAVVNAGARRIGLLAFSDHPAEYAAGEGRPGIAYADLRAGIPEWIGAELRRLRAECDEVIAFPHWGPNMTTEPAGWQRRAAAELTDAGADLVTGHSAHVFHGVGWGERGPILYDLGDALDDYAVDPELRNDLGLFAIWSPGADPALELVGLRLDYCHTRVAAGPDAEWIAARLTRACEPLGTAVERLAESQFRISGPGDA